MTAPIDGRAATGCEPQPYGSAAAVDRAISDAARAAFRTDRSLSVQARVKQEYFRRFLSRVFSEGPHSDWILKGGTGILARAASARSTLDVDLFRARQTLDGALDDLKRLAAIDLGDFFRFAYRRHDPVVTGEEQDYTDGYRVVFDVYVGGDQKEPLHVDLVVGVIVTDEVTIAAPANALSLPRLRSHDYRLYPVVDQIADKVCATLASYHGYPSSRQKDLVDLVVLAVTESIDADRLRVAIEREAAARRLAGPTAFGVPDTWGSGYEKLAKDISYCDGYRTVAAAEALVKRLIDPILDGSAAGRRWSHTTLRFA